MHIFSSLKKAAASSQPNDTPANSPPKTSGNWKLELFSQFKTSHRGWPEGVDELIKSYVFEDVTEDSKPNLDSVLRGCLALGEEAMLHAICEHEGIRSWCIEGQVGANEWETLESSGKGLPIEALKLSNIRFDSSTGAMLFRVLGRMPALNSLTFENVGFEGSTLFFSMRDCPPLKLLEDLKVTVLADGFDVCPLLIKILEACQLRTLSIEECAAISVDQHKDLAKALGRQTRLSSLKLEISMCNTPAQFECYVKFLGGNTSLTRLDLSGCDLGIENCNSLLTTLASKPALTSLCLRDCQLMNDSESKLQILPLAAMPSLRELDLAGNHLAEDTMVPLLAALERNKQACLSCLDLSDNPITALTMHTVASLLKANRTLLWLSLKRTSGPGIYGADELAPLADALAHNTSLLRLDLGWPVPNPTRVRLTECLQRNRASLRSAVMRSGWQVLLNARPPLPRELVDLILGHELVPSDFLNLSSVNHQAWDLRQELFLQTGPST